MNVAEALAWLDASYLGNTLRAWLAAAVLVVGVTFGLELMKSLVLRRLRQIAERSANEVDDLIVELVRAVRVTTIVGVALYIGTRVVVLPAQADQLIRIVLTVIGALQAGAWGNVLIKAWLERQFRRSGEDASTAAGYGAIQFVARVVLWAVILLLALDNVGIEVTALVAGLGVGGIAVALAVQNVLGDIFCSLSIVLDKPFEVGDFIVIGDLMGTVENIGVKTTRVRSLGGEQLVFSNSDLVTSRIRNFKRMYERRVVFEFGVIYQTTVDQLEWAATKVREIIEGLEDLRFDRAHFKSFGDSALVFEVVYYVCRPEYNVYMDRQQAINLALVRAFDEKGIEFAYPTRTLYVHQESAAAGAAG